MESSTSSSNLPKSSLFFADQRLCSADIIPPPQVRARIEVAVLNFLKSLASPTPAISDLPLISRTSGNSSLRRGLLSDISSVFLSNAFSVRSLTRSNDTKAFIRVWKVMQLCFQILGQEKLVTQRELFYKLLCDSPGYFTSQEQVNRTVQDVVALLRCSRQSLGIMASSRGAIIGRLVLQEPGQETIDCAVLGPAGHAITGDLSLLSKLDFASDARYIIIVEKDAIFHRLAEDRLYNQVPSILITAKGYPDIATRFILHRLSQAFPDMPILALVDWNPAGLAILCTYKFGSITMGLEAYRYACNVKWLGLRGDDLQHVPEPSLVQLKPRDLQIAKSLMSSEVLQGNKVFSENILFFNVQLSNRTGRSWQPWWRRGIEWRLKLFTTTATISWVSTLRQRLYSLTTSESINLHLSAKCSLLSFPLTGVDCLMHLQFLTIVKSLYLSEIPFTTFMETVIWGCLFARKSLKVSKAYSMEPEVFQLVPDTSVSI